MKQNRELWCSEHREQCSFSPWSVKWTILFTEGQTALKSYRVVVDGVHTCSLRALRCQISYVMRLGLSAWPSLSHVQVRRETSPSGCSHVLSTSHLVHICTNSNECCSYKAVHGTLRTGL